MNDYELKIPMNNLNSSYFQYLFLPSLLVYFYMYVLANTILQLRERNSNSSFASLAIILFNYLQFHTCS